MASRARKLLLVQEHDPTIASSLNSHSGISSNTLSSQINNQSKIKCNDDYYSSSGVTSSSYGGFSGYRLNPPFDTSMALTVLVLLIVLFFMGFFSVYVRRFSDNSSRLRRRLSAYTTTRSSRKNGVDTNTLNSLPVYSYSGSAKQGIKADLECVICLSEFEEGEIVKVIPYCGHVFHIDCIEMWLACHVTCPLCRTAKLFPTMEPEVRVTIECEALGEGSRSTVDGRDTWSEEVACMVGPDRLRRSSSCSLSSVRSVLRRSLSF